VAFQCRSIALALLVATALSCASSSERFAEYVGHENARICYATHAASGTARLRSHVVRALGDVSAKGRYLYACDSSECLVSQAAGHECELAIFVSVDRSQISRTESWTKSKVTVNKQPRICATKNVDWRGEGNAFFRVVDPVTGTTISTGSLRKWESSRQMAEGFYLRPDGRLSSTSCNYLTDKSEQAMTDRLLSPVAGYIVSGIAESLPEVEQPVH